MKKLVGIVCSVFLIGNSVMSTMASTNEVSLQQELGTFLTASQTDVTVEKISQIDRVEIQELYDEMTGWIEDVLEAENISIDVSSQIEFDQSLKLYSGTDILQLRTSDYDDIMTALDAGDYIYVLYASVGNYKMEINLAKGKDVTEEARKYLTEAELLEVKENVGKWQIVSVGIVEQGELCYDENMDEYLAIYDDLVLVQSLQGIEYPVYIGFQDNVAVDIIPIYESNMYPAIASMEVIETTYDFNELADFALTIEPSNESEEIIICDEIEESEMLVIDEAIISSSSPVKLSVSRFAQERTSWCWAACAQMIGNYMTGTKKTQASIVEYVKGAVINEGGTQSENKKAVQYTIGSNYTASAKEVVTLAQFKYYINKGQPASIRITASTGAGHRYVVAGYQDSKLFLIDPWEDEVDAWYSYTALVNGVELPTIEGQYTYTILVV